MNKNPTLQSMLTHLAEEAALPGEIDLWPGIAERLKLAGNNSNREIVSFDALNDPQGQGHPARFLRKNRQFRLVVLSVLGLLVLAGLIFAVPQGRAWADELLHFFTRAGSDNLPVQSWQLIPLPTPGTPTPDPASILDVHQTVSEVEQLAGNQVFQPAWLPDVLSLVGASFQPDHRIVRIFYRSVESNGLVLTQEPFQRSEDCELCKAVSASAVIEPVQIGPVSGEYVEGVWKLTDQGPVWESDPYVKRIRWQANNVAFELLYMGPPDTLTKDDLTAVAQSIK